MELMPVYGPPFKEQIVKKMMPPHIQSVSQISRYTGVAVPNLFSWIKLFRIRVCLQSPFAQMNVISKPNWPRSFRRPL
jgi:hypothetical protein